MKKIRQASTLTGRSTNSYGHRGDVNNVAHQATGVGGADVDIGEYCH